MPCTLMLNPLPTRIESTVTADATHTARTAPNTGNRPLAAWAAHQGLLAVALDPTLHAIALDAAADLPLAGSVSTPPTATPAKPSPTPSSTGTTTSAKPEPPESAVQMAVSHRSAGAQDRSTMRRLQPARLPRGPVRLHDGQRGTRRGPSPPRWLPPPAGDRTTTHPACA